MTTQSDEVAIRAAEDFHFAPCAHEWQEQEEEYGADRDGNRYVIKVFWRCKLCGDEG